MGTHALRWWRVVLGVPVFLSCTACWDSTEIDRLAIVTASGVDLKQDEHGKRTVVGTVQIARPSELGSGGGGAPQTSTGETRAFILEQGRGDIAIAPLEQIRSHLSRRLFMGHRRVLIIGENYARHGVSDVMDEVVRNPQSRLRTYVLVAYHDEAANILKLPYSLNRLPSDAIVDMEQQGTALNIDAKQFLQSLTQWGDPVAMGIESIQSLHEVSKKSAETFTLGRIAVFQKDKLVGWLNGDAVRGFLWINGRKKTDLTTVSLPWGRGMVSGRLMSSHTTRSVSMQQARPLMRIHVHAEYDLSENDSRMQASDPAAMAQVRQVFSKEISDEMRATMTELQKTYDSDPFGFADKFFEKYPRLWKAKMKAHWREEYPSIPVQIETDVVIRNNGLTDKPIQAVQNTY